jgi:hypothetical protein
MWKWIWPPVGAVPINQGLDTEMFDRVDYPYSETFVREAIQNTLDARLDQSKPVVISFRFHSASVGERKPFLEMVRAFRNKAHLSWSDDWARDRMTWLTVEDFNSKGLSGSLSDRTSDFWNYWLNFGLSNKDGTGRGGRGIGRVTFLIASQIQTVLGLTRRYFDGSVAACGMSVLRAQKDDEDFLSTHAYMAREMHKSIYQLHDSREFFRDLRNAFELKGFEGEYTSGFALVVPYPHEELRADGIIAASIEHFAPAIMNGSLIVNVNERSLNAGSIRQIAPTVNASFRAESIKRDVNHYLNLIEFALAGDLVPLQVAGLKPAFEGQRETDEVRKLQAELSKLRPVGINLMFPLHWSGQTKSVNVRAVLSRSSSNQSPVDRLFREGMSLPDVKAKIQGEIDLILLVDEPTLATYLNFCEGKAHLDLLESKDTKAKLKEAGFETNFLVRRFIKALPTELRSLLTPDIVQPDSKVFDEFFAIPIDGSGVGLGRKKKTSPINQGEINQFPPPKTPAFLVETLANGFRLRANPKFSSWPVNVSATVAYANGSRSLSWSEYDFRLNELDISNSGCQIELNKNRLHAKNCNSDCRIEVTGFDSNRELDTRLKVWTHAT